MNAASAYQPLRPARRPGGKPPIKPGFRVLVHRQYLKHYRQLVERVGAQQAQQLWDHVATSPGQPDPIAQTSFLRGRAGQPWAPGWSRTIHYEISSMARINYSYNAEYVGEDGDIHPIVAILSIDFSGH